MKRFYISQPMHGLTDEEIQAERDRAAERLLELYPSEDGMQIISNFMPEFYVTNPVAALGDSISSLEDVDMAFFIGDWQSHRGCRIEHMVCMEYGIPVGYL